MARGLRPGQTRAGPQLGTPLGSRGARDGGVVAPGPPTPGSRGAREPERKQRAAAATASTAPAAPAAPAETTAEKIRRRLRESQGLAEELVPTGAAGRLRGGTQVSSELDRRDAPEALVVEQANIADQLKAGKAETDVDVGTELDRLESEQADLDIIRQGRSEDIAEVIARRKGALSGLSGEAQQVQRDVAARQIGQSSEQQRRRLQAIQARTGVRGGTAAAQQLQSLQGGLRTRANFERDLFLKNEEIKRSALGSLEKSLTAAERGEFERQVARSSIERFNIQERRQVGQINLGQQLSERRIEESNISRRIRQEEFNIGQQSAADKFNIQGKSEVERFNIRSQAAASQFNIVERGRVESLNLAQQLRERELATANVERELGREKFNIAQASRERFGRLQTAFGITALTGQDEASQAAIASQLAAASESSGGK